MIMNKLDRALAGQLCYMFNSFLSRKESFNFNEMFAKKAKGSELLIQDNKCKADFCSYFEASVKEANETMSKYIDTDYPSYANGSKYFVIWLQDNIFKLHSFANM